MMRYVLVKRNLYWRPNGQGYTASLAEAGIYTADYDGSVNGYTNILNSFDPTHDPDTTYVLEIEKAPSYTTIETKDVIGILQNAIRQAIVTLDNCPHRTIGGIGGQTIDAQIRSTVINNVPAMLVEDLLEALNESLQ